MATNDGGTLWIGDKLPTMYDAATTIIYLAPTLKSVKRLVLLMILI